VAGVWSIRVIRDFCQGRLFHFFYDISTLVEPRLDFKYPEEIIPAFSFGFRQTRRCGRRTFSPYRRCRIGFHSHVTEDLQFQAGFHHAIAAPTPQPIIYVELVKVPDNSSVSRNKPRGIDYGLQRRIHIVTTRIFEGKQGSEGFVVGLRLIRCLTLASTPRVCSTARNAWILRQFMISTRRARLPTSLWSPKTSFSSFICAFQLVVQARK
jgi:hypothetical protein